MIRLTGLTEAPRQRHRIRVGAGVCRLTLTFAPVTACWHMDIAYEGAQKKAVYGVKLSAGVFHIKGANLPLDFWVVDTTGLGTDPYQADDFSSGRRRLYYFEPEEMAVIRGYEVQE